MSLEVYPESYDYEQTLMYGKFTSELRDFARTETLKMRRERAERRLEEQKPQSSNGVWRAIKKFVVTQIGEDWLFLLIIGVIMALLSFTLDYLIEKSQQAHVWLYKSLTEIVIVQYLIWITFPLVFISFAVGFTNLVSVNAIGSGIPEMKTVLRGIQLTQYLSVRTFLAKTIGLIAALGSGIPLGKEGPFVHIASIVGAQLSKFLTHFSSVFNNEAHNNELLAAAAAVGVACNFAAPIGGVLFSIEVTATYFAVRNYWRGFFAAVCGAFLFRLASVFVKDEETITALFNTGFRAEFPFDVNEEALNSFLGVVSGFGGALFVYFHRRVVEIRRKYRNKTRFLEKSRFIYPLIVVFVISTLEFPGGFGKFMAGELTQKQTIDQLFSNFTWSAEGALDKAQDNVVQFWNKPNVYVSLVLFTTIKFITSAISVSLPVPTGVFFPVFVVGAGFGRIVGEAMTTWFPNGIKGSGEIIPGGYAVVGAAAMSGAVTHTISTSVIVFELTGQITHILPVMIAVLIANAIAQYLQPSFYDSIIQIKQLPYLPDLKRGRVYDIMVKDIMKHRLFFVTYTSSYADLKSMLHKSDLRSFPIVDSPDSMILLGSVQRQNLQQLLFFHRNKWTAEQEKAAVQVVLNTPDSGLRVSSADCLTVPQEVPDSPTSSGAASPSSPHMVGSSTLKRLGGRVTSLLRRSSSPMPTEELTNVHTMSGKTLTDQQIEEEEWPCDFLQTPVDFSDCQIDASPFQLVERTSLHKAHSLFALLGLSHSYVTSIGRLIGVVALKELTEAIEGAHKGESRRQEAEPPSLAISDADETTASETFELRPLNGSFA
ncbi:chloride channel protein 2-like [Corticium candelabrum]|uniref:chloride channel protein 2-like n=1 Tax=Corticium candelabrum TaxID=121492 RepID=UPI002E26437D|nr:chloride channel protein 2-like [Corticium candelabrum]